MGTNWCLRCLNCDKYGLHKSSLKIQRITNQSDTVMKWSHTSHRGAWTLGGVMLRACFPGNNQRHVHPFPALSRGPHQGTRRVAVRAAPVMSTFSTPRKSSVRCVRGLSSAPPYCGSRAPRVFQQWNTSAHVVNSAQELGPLRRSAVTGSS